jgi:hypothetical protein
MPWRVLISKIDGGALASTSNGEGSGIINVTTGLARLNEMDDSQNVIVSRKVIVRPCSQQYGPPSISGSTQQALMFVTPPLQGLR